MPRFVTSPEEHSIRYNQWKGFVENMSDFVRPDSLTNNMSEKELESNNKYTRFVSYTREWISAVLNANYGGSTRSLRSSEYAYLDVTSRRLDDGWFKNIMKVKDGKELGNSFEFPTLYYGSETDCAYDVFMPAYRALKESFDKRSIWQWFTNHAQYTAERDAIKALEGTMMALTQSNMAEIKTAYNEYCQQLPNYDTETIKDATKDFESQPKFSMLVGERQRFKYKQITGMHSFDRKLRSDIYDVVKDIDTIDDIKVRLALRIANSVRDNMDYLCSHVDIASVNGPESEAKEIDNNLKFNFRVVFARLREQYVGAKDALIKAQKIIDIALKSHFPSLFVDGRHADLANNYIIGNKERLAEIVSTMEFKGEDRDALVDEIYNEFRKDKEPEPAPAPETEKVEQIDSTKERLDLSAELGENKEVEKSPENKETSAPVVAQEKVN